MTIFSVAFQALYATPHWRKGRRGTKVFPSESSSSFLLSFRLLCLSSLFPFSAPSVLNRLLVLLRADSGGQVLELSSIPPENYFLAPFSLSLSLSLSLCLCLSSSSFFSSSRVPPQRAPHLPRNETEIQTLEQEEGREQPAKT
jgi:hypothetical protein